MSLDTAIAASRAILAERLRDRQPQVAILLGSGWGAVADQVADAIDVPYADLPAFPRLGVGGHAGVLRSGTIGNKPVLVLAGRKHAYETGEADGMKGAVRTLAAFGIQLLVQTNAAGSCDDRMRPGQLMLISDHLNLSQRSPLFGEPGDDRFIDMSSAYDAGLRAQAQAAAIAPLLLERLEHRVRRAVRQPAALVLDLEPDPLGVHVRPQPHPAAGAGELERVLQHVGDRGGEQRLVDLDVDVRIYGRDGQLEAADRRLQHAGDLDVLDEPTDRDAHSLDQPRVDAHRRQRAPDQLPHPPQAPLQHAAGAPADRDRAALEHLKREDRRRDRKSVV